MITLSLVGIKINDLVKIYFQYMFTCTYMNTTKPMISVVLGMKYQDNLGNVSFSMVEAASLG